MPERRRLSWRAPLGIWPQGLIGLGGWAEPIKEAREEEHIEALLVGEKEEREIGLGEGADRSAATEEKRGRLIPPLIRERRKAEDGAPRTSWLWREKETMSPAALAVEENKSMYEADAQGGPLGAESAKSRARETLAVSAEERQQMWPAERRDASRPSGKTQTGWLLLAREGGRARRRGLWDEGLIEAASRREFGPGPVPAAEAEWAIAEPLMELRQRSGRGGARGAFDHEGELRLELRR